MARIAESVRRVVHARAAIVSRVVDGEWLEVLTVAGTASRNDLIGLRWPRPDLQGLLEEADQRGRIHLTRRRAVSYVQVPEDEWHVPGLLGLVVVPLRSADGDLVGVLFTEGHADAADPAPGAYELVELYADQARLALEAWHLRRIASELRQLEEYRSDLVASLAHDLRTPLTAISLNAELLASGEREPAAGPDPVATIRRSAERLSGLVDDLMTLSGAETDARAEVGDLTEAVRDACRHVEAAAQARSITLVVDMPEQLTARTDVDALARVYANVVGNAVKFSLPDGQVRITLRRDGGVVELVCADDGIGIAAADQAAVFDMFRRSRDPKVPGAGVGLAISQRIVTRLGGTIEVTSTPGAGSSFVVTVPG